MKRSAGNPLKRRISDRVYEALKKSRNSNVIDLDEFRQGKANQAELHEQLSERAARFDAEAPDLPWQIRRDLDVVHFAYGFGAGLMELREMSRFAEAIDAAEEEYQPGEPPMSPVLDSLFMSWSLFDLQVGRFRETPASVVFDLAKRLTGERDDHPLLARLGELIRSHLRIVECTATPSSTSATVRDVITGEELSIVRSADLTIRPGEMVLWRLIPPHATETEWVGTLTPYVIIDTPASEWLAYVERHAEPGQSATEAYPTVMRPHEDRLRWLEYVFQGYSKYHEGRIHIEGIPDRPNTLPHSDSFDEILDGDADRDEDEDDHEYNLRISRLASTSLQAYFSRQPWLRDVVANSLGRVPDGEHTEIIRNAIVMPLMLYVIPYRGKSPAARYLASQPDLPAPVLEYLRAVSDEPPSLYEVLEVDRGSGVLVVDLLRGGESYVHERSGSNTLSVREVVFGRLVKFEGHPTFDGMFPMPLPPSARDEVVAAFRQRLRTPRGVIANHQLVDAAMDLVGLMLAAYEKSVSQARSRTQDAQTLGGDRLVVCTTTYRFDRGHRKLVVAELMNDDEFQPQPRPNKQRARSFVWPWEHQPQAVRGHIEVRDTRLEINTASREDDLRLRTRLTDRLGEVLRHERSEEKRPEEIRSLDAEEVDEASPPEEMSDEQKAQLTHFFGQQYAKFLDQSLPALGDRSPRECARTAAGRRQVDELFREHEYHLSRQGISHVVDFDAWRRELSIERSPVRPT